MFSEKKILNKKKFKRFVINDFEREKNDFEF